MDALPPASRYALVAIPVACLALVVAVLLWPSAPLSLALGLLPCGAAYLCAQSMRQAARAARCAEQSAAALRGRAAQLEAVLACARSLHLGQPREELLQVVAEGARALLGAASAAAYLPDSDDATMLQRVCLTPADATEIGPTYAATPAAGTPMVQPQDGGRTLLVSLAADQESAAGLLRVMGVPAAHDPIDDDLLALLAGHATLALQNARLHEDALAQASADSLTGLPNHRTLQARLAEEVVRARRSQEGAPRPLTLLMVDLDDFRSVNNTYGHQAGDAILVAVARALRRILRVSDVPARYGGDEFAVILPETGLEEGLEVAGRLRAAIEAVALSKGAARIRIGASVGVATLPQHATTREELIQAADQAAYRAKHAGKGCVACPEQHVLALACDPAGLAGQLAQATMADIQALAAAVDAKDPGTQGHSQRVATYAAAIAQALRLGSADIARIRMAGLVHDIGKITVPDAILTKAGALTPEEAALVRRHPEAGEQLLAAVPFLREILPAVRHHHERWDGRGYPDRLAGEAIPHDAAILMVADAFDVMTSSRTYRSALPIGEARRRLRAESGTQFDPRVVAAFDQAVSDGTLIPLSSRGTLPLHSDRVA